MSYAGNADEVFSFCDLVKNKLSGFIAHRLPDSGGIFPLEQGNGGRFDGLVVLVSYLAADLARLRKE